jgi:hypothetical protein
MFEKRVFTFPKQRSVEIRDTTADECEVLGDLANSITLALEIGNGHYSITLSALEAFAVGAALEAFAADRIDLEPEGGSS